MFSRSIEINRGGAKVVCILVKRGAARFSTRKIIFAAQVLYAARVERRANYFGRLGTHLALTSIANVTHANDEEADRPGCIFCVIECVTSCVKWT